MKTFLWQRCQIITRHWPKEQWQALVALRLVAEVEICHNELQALESRINACATQQTVVRAEAEFLVASNLPIVMLDSAQIESQISQLKLARGEMLAVVQPPWRKQPGASPVCLLVTRRVKRRIAQGNELLDALDGDAQWQKFQGSHAKAIRLLEWSGTPFRPSEIQGKMECWVAESRGSKIPDRELRNQIRWWREQEAIVSKILAGVERNFLATLSKPVRVGADLSIVTLVTPKNVETFRQAWLTWKFPRRVAVKIILAGGVLPEDLAMPKGVSIRNVSCSELPEISHCIEFSKDEAAWLLATGNAVAATERWVWLDAGAFQGSFDGTATLFHGPDWADVHFGFPGKCLINTATSKRRWPQLTPSLWIGAPASLFHRNQLSELLSDWTKQSTRMPMEMYLPFWLEEKRISYQIGNLAQWGWNM